MKKSVCASRSASAIVRKISEKSKEKNGKNARNSSRVKNAENRVATAIVKNQIAIKIVEKIEKKIGGRENASESPAANEIEERTRKRNASGGLEVVSVSGTLVGTEKRNVSLVVRVKESANLVAMVKGSANLVEMVKGSVNLVEMVKGSATLVGRSVNLVGIEKRNGSENLVARWIEEVGRGGTGDVRGLETGGGPHALAIAKGAHGELQPAKESKTGTRCFKI